LMIYTNSNKQQTTNMGLIINKPNNEQLQQISLD